MDIDKKTDINGRLCICKLILIMLLLGFALFCVFGMDYSADGRLLMGWLLVLIAAICLRIPHRKTYVETYGWRQDTVKKDILRKLSVTGLDVVLLPPVLFHCVVALVFPVGEIHGTVTVIVAVAAIAGCIGLVIKLIRLEKLRKGAISLRWDTFDSKSVHTDGEGPDTYSITYRNENSYWTRSVSEKEYESAADGDIIQTAYLDGENKPVLWSRLHGRRK